ncbi:MAG: formate dehydrogenase subunit delta [Colwellia sp.]
MSISQLENIIKMANQIASNNAYKKTDEQTADFVVNHIQLFWAQSMKSQLLAYAKSDGSELIPAVKIAAINLSSV